MKLRHLSRLTIGLLLLLSWASANAEPLLNGLASHSELGKEQFIAALYADSLSSAPSTLISANEQKRMELRVTARRLSARRLNSMWIEGMAINIPGNLLSKHADNMIKFTGLIKGKLVAGDRLTIDSRPGEGSTISVNGIELGSIVADGFFELLLRTWIGSVPLSSDFRDQMLKAGEVDMALRARYEAITPTEKRIATIKGWKTPRPTQSIAAAKPAPTKNISAPAITQAQGKPPVSVAAPTLAMAPTRPTAEQSKPDAKPEETPEPEPQPTPAEAVAMSEAELDDETLEDDVEDDTPVLTAETLLSQQLYHSKLLKWTYKYLSYPKRALKRRQEGSVRLSVIIDREGNVTGVSQMEGSRFALLNKEALGAIKRAEPFPPIPEALNREKFEFTLPIVFRLPK